MKKLKLVGILAAVVLIGSVISIPLINNHTAPTFFGTSLPEVIDIKENEDGTVTLTVDAVCDMVICDDAVITHELTVKFADDGSFQYLGNKILDNGIKEIPAYQYRINVN